MNCLDGAETGKWVLLPGTLCTNQVFVPVLDQLGVEQKDRQFIIADAPDVRDYAATLEAQVTNGDIACGFSLGALVLAHNTGALSAARAVVLLACNPFPDPPGKRANREAVRDRVLAGEAWAWIEGNWAAMSTSVNHEHRELACSMADDTAHLIEVQTELAASRPGAADQLMSSDLPLIFVTGSEDQLTPWSFVQEVVAGGRTAHLSVLEGLGHFALIEAPDRVAEAIKRGFDAVGLTL